MILVYHSAVSIGSYFITYQTDSNQMNQDNINRYYLWAYVLVSMDNHYANPCLSRLAFITAWLVDVNQVSAHVLDNVLACKGNGKVQKVHLCITFPHRHIHRSHMVVDSELMMRDDYCNLLTKDRMFIYLVSNFSYNVIFYFLHYILQVNFFDTILSIRVTDRIFNSTR